MTSGQYPVNLNELTTWLAEDDANSREARVERLQELLVILPGPFEEFLAFNGGEETLNCFLEVRRCYLDGSYIAVVLLSLLYIERELAAVLYAGGWGKPQNRPQLSKILNEACNRGLISNRDKEVFGKLADIRNSYAHFRSPCSDESLMVRSDKQNDFPREVLAKDARCALETMYRLLRRSGAPLLTEG
ncbi:MAG: hypothetical protein OXF95_01760 [Rhodobacteraceae bacterium]|nr:hypothetical protein [Paracoccaceae bacterium]